MPTEPDEPPRINGWLVLLHPIFEQRYRSLLANVRRLNNELASEEAYRQHPTVKLTAAVRRLVLEIVPQNPNARDFLLTRPPQHFRRAKKKGLSPRYRLFWVASVEASTIIFLYLNDEATLRKEGARTDPYAIFKRLVERGEIGADFQANLAAFTEESTSYVKEELLNSVEVHVVFDLPGGDAVVVGLPFVALGRDVGGGVVVAQGGAHYAIAFQGVYSLG